MGSQMKLQGDEASVLALRAQGLTWREIGAAKGVSDSVVRRILGKTGKVRQGKARPIVIRFWEKVEKGEGCWEWTGAFGKPGYGHIKVNKKYVDAHRLSYQLNVGPIPPKLLVLHKCNNKRCVRPDHLKVGTQSDNMKQYHDDKALKTIGEPSVSVRSVK